MRDQRTRRDFLADVGRGTIVATIGSALASDLGLASISPLIDEGTKREADRLVFGSLEPLVGLMQETPVERLLPAVVDKLKNGTSLRDLAAAAALANARTFGGEDYVGFHTMMAIAPAYHMSRELPENQQALPILKVLYRNTSRIGEFGGRAKEVLREVDPVCSCCLPGGQSPGEAIRDAARAKDIDRAEGVFAGIERDKPEDALNQLLLAVQDNTEVHRTVLPYRAWDLLGLIGHDQAHTLLRQSVRYCVKSERDWRHSPEDDRPRVVLPRLMDQYKLAGKSPGKREVDDAWVESMSKTIFEGTPDSAADAVAAALAEGIEPNAIGQAISLATNQLVLRDAGRTGKQVQPGKPEGSVHGDSIGVHASDSANAWRNMAAITNTRNTFACLILGAFQMAQDRVSRGGDFLKWTPRPHPEDLAALKTSDRASLLGELPSAIRGNDQARAAAIVHRLGETGNGANEVFPILLGFAISEDGALHAEKYYRTVREEFACHRPAFRWRQLVALARVTASEYGRPAAGYAEARALLKL